MNLPNALTFLRLLLSPLYLILFVYPDRIPVAQNLRFFLLAVVVTIMLITDALDGYLARKLKKETAIGKILDPMSDCVVFLVFFFSFTCVPISIPLWIPLVMMAREIFMVYLRSALMTQNIYLAARFSGKMKTLLQSFVVVMVIGLLFIKSLGYECPIVWLQVCHTLAKVTAFVSFFSLVEYLVYTRRDLRKIFN